MKINRYIKYLPILILLAGINVYAQTTENLNQIVSQAQQEASGLSPFFNLSSIINSPIKTYLTNSLGSSFLGFAIPFLFVFGVLSYITYEAKKEIIKPLLVIYFIIDLLVTIFFPAILILLAITLAIVLLFLGFYKLFHTFTGNTMGGITGAIITTLILYVLLTNGTNIMGVLLSSAFYILLFIFFIFIFIYGYKISQSSDINKLKKIIYHIHTPQDVRNFQNDLSNRVNNFRQSVNQLTNEFLSLVGTLQSYLRQQQPLRNIDDLINLLRDIRDNINKFINKYEKYKMVLDQIETSINIRHKEPLRSYLLKILEKEGRKEIENIARTASQPYRSRYNFLLRNKNNIKNLALNIIRNQAQRRRYDRTIDHIFDDIDDAVNNLPI